jgi:hypothetical protein
MGSGAHSRRGRDRSTAAQFAWRSPWIHEQPRRGITVFIARAWWLVSAPRETLGERHPLVRALADLDAAARQLTAVAAALGAGLLGSAAGAAWGRAVAITAGWLPWWWQFG